MDPQVTPGCTFRARQTTRYPHVYDSICTRRTWIPETTLRFDRKRLCRRFDSTNRIQEKDNFASRQVARRYTSTSVRHWWHHWDRDNALSPAQIQAGDT